MAYFIRNKIYKGFDLVNDVFVSFMGFGRDTFPRKDFVIIFLT